MYQQLKNEKGEITKAVKRISNNAITFIPFDSDNTDYQEYLAWIAEGNEPLPADE